MAKTPSKRSQGEIRVGISGWVYPGWRGGFYPRGLTQARELAYASERLGSIEINGTFYSLQTPASFAKWRDETPKDFRFAVKGSRFITHMKKLRAIELPLANYFASGPLVLGEKLGPFLWQIGANMPLDMERFEPFLELLPKSAAEAAKLAREHDDRVGDDSWTRATADVPVRHALEARHSSYFAPDVLKLLRGHGVALVIVDSAGTLPETDELTADFVYVRLHGMAKEHTKGYSDAAIAHWARRIRDWAARGDVFVYFDNDAKARAPFDAMRMMDALGIAKAAETAVTAPPPAKAAKAAGPAKAKAPRRPTPRSRS